MNLRCVSTLTLAIALAVPAQAALHVRGGGTMVYDDVLDVTWAADAGPVFADVFQARAYVASLTLGGFTDWRLPSIYDKGTTDICVGFNCTQSEVGYMHYVNFGSVANQFTFAGTNAANIALFHNYAGADRWGYAEDFTEANRQGLPVGGCNMTPGAEDCTFLFRNDGIQSYGGTVQPMKAWAVRDGDVDGPVGPVVPEPATWAMLIAGFGLVGSALRRRRTAFAA